MPVLGLRGAVAHGDIIIAVTCKGEFGSQVEVGMISWDGRRSEGVMVGCSSS